MHFPNASLPRARTQLAGLVAIAIALSAGTGLAAADPAGSAAAGGAAASQPLPAAAATSGSAEERLAQLEGLYRQAERERQKISAITAQLEERLRVLEEQAALARQMATHTEAIERLNQRLDGPGTGAAAVAEGGVVVLPETSGGDTVDAAIEATRLREGLAATERRLSLLIEQFAAAHLLREKADAQAAAARSQVAELTARLQQQQLEVQEARLRAEKAEKLQAALEEANARAVSDGERLAAELATARDRQAEALKQTVALDAKLAAVQARLVEIESAVPPVRAGAETALPAPALPAVAVVAAAAPAAIAATDPDAEPVVAAQAVYRVRAEDTLSRISAQVYGDPGAWPRIYEANRDVLPTPDRLAPGMTLVIP